MSDFPNIKGKPRVNDVMARLGRCKFKGQCAGDYLYQMLGGYDEVAEWTYEEGAKFALSKLRGEKSISIKQVRNWFQKRAAKERQELYIGISVDAQAKLLKNNPDIDPVSLSNAAIGMAIGQVMANEEPEVAVKIISAMTGLKKQVTEEGKLQQRIKEHEESTAKLKAKIAALEEKANKGGFKGDPNTHIKDVVRIVDEVMGIGNRGK